MAVHWQWIITLECENTCATVNTCGSMHAKQFNSASWNSIPHAKRIVILNSQLRQPYSAIDSQLEVDILLSLYTYARGQGSFDWKCTVSGETVMESSEASVRKNCGTMNNNTIRVSKLKMERYMTTSLHLSWQVRFRRHVGKTRAVTAPQTRILSGYKGGGSQRRWGR